MVTAEPKLMPSGNEASPSESFQHSMMSLVISDHLRSSRFPAFLDVPRKVAVERDGGAITHPGRTQPDDRTSQHLTPSTGAVLSRLDLQFHRGSRQQAVVEFDERAAGRYIDHPRAMARPHA